MCLFISIYVSIPACLCLSLCSSDSFSESVCICLSVWVCELLKLLKCIKRIFVYYYFLLELLINFSPRSFVHQCHYPRGTSIRWTFDTSRFELLNNCSELEACDVVVLFRGFLQSKYAVFMFYVLGCKECAKSAVLL
jgi:hypothetical protein